ncbi:hypothetical protein O7627_22040 [Solwaraspora sp. WMMD1047]|uniref:hypothetical protein n=1 Tax=Solwaraspora sp. WMMD1047 TaxID=3016102 RepID=UPI002416D471|nr:hypothetical protein [Solwaraspora sp. WMMD1047]MDG4831966.1 hypothetical protein [Solwaraspora sp. WMMD1047]
MLTLTVLGCLAVGSGAGLAGGLISCQPTPTLETARPLSPAEARRLAAMRVTNYQDGRVGLRATLGLAGDEIEVTGAVDWGRELIYLTVTGPGAGEHRGLLQAGPGLVATRPAPATGRTPARPSGPATTGRPTDDRDPAAGTTAGARPPAGDPPAATRPGPTEPPSTEPGSAEPGSAQPGSTGPASTEPGSTQPGGTEPGASDPPAGQPATGDPATGDPAAEEPATDNPATGDPTPGEPATGEPATGKPETAGPGQTGPAGGVFGPPAGAPGPVVAEPAGPPREAATAAAEQPPVAPPQDGWRVRRMGGTGTEVNPLDSFLALIFAAAADRPDRPEALERSEARWLGRDRAGGATVDVLLGPAVSQASWDSGPASPTPTALTEMGGAVRYWLDSDARLHRIEALLGENVPVQVDLDRTTRPEVTAVAALGGLPVLPRAVTADEAELLARLRPTNLDQGGATVALTVPTVPAERLLPGDGPTVNLRGAGWVNWYGGNAYLAVHDLDEPTERLLLRADPAGVAARTVRREDDAPAHGADPPRDGRPGAADLPPLPAPIDRAWSYRQWPERTDRLGGLDLDLLVSEVLSLGDQRAGDLAALRRSAVWLRRDVVAGQKVTVFELPKPVEADTPRGQARMRYWVDRSGLLRRLELRTRTGAFAQLDLHPGQVPELPWVPTN